jgi:recombination protein RecA
MSVDLGIVKKSGAWFTYEGEQLGQGRENAKTFLAANPEIMMEISDKVLTAAGLKPGADDAGDIDVAGAGAFSDKDDEPITLE